MWLCVWARMCMCACKVRLRRPALLPAAKGIITNLFQTDRSRWGGEWIKEKVEMVKGDSAFWGACAAGLRYFSQCSIFFPWKITTLSFFSFCLLSFLSTSHPADLSLVQWFSTGFASGFWHQVATQHGAKNSVSFCFSIYFYYILYSCLVTL